MRWSSSNAAPDTTSARGPRSAGPRRAGLRRRLGLVLAGYLVGPWTAAAAAVPPPPSAPPAEVESVTVAEFFAPGALHSFNLELPPASLASLRTAPRRFVLGTLRFGGQPPWAVEVRIKGESGSAQSVDEKPAWTVDFLRLPSGPEPGSARRFLGLSRLQFHNGAEDPSYFHEWLGGQVFRDAGIPYPQVTHTRLTLNGKALGLYVVREGFTAEFLATQFPPGDGVLYDNDTGRDVDADLHVNLATRQESLATAAAHWRALRWAVQEPDPVRRWETLGERLDADPFLRFIGTEVVLGHRDGYALARNNFRVYFDPRRQRFMFLADGLDQLLGSPELPWLPHFSGLLAQAMVSTPAGKARYRAELQALLAGPAAEARVVPLLESATTRLRARLSPVERPALEAAHRDLAQRYRQRLAALRTQLQADELPHLRPGVDGVSLGNWKAWDAGEGSRLEQTPAPDGSPALHFVASARTSASWRTRVHLPPGRYVMRGRGWVRGVQPVDPRRPQGLALRQSGKPRLAAGLSGDTLDWQDLMTVVVVSAESEQPAELLVEFTARSGEAWVELGTLRIFPENPTGADR